MCAVGMLITPHSVFAQSKISLNRKGESINKLIEEIEALSDYKFFYNNELVDVSKKVNVSVSNANIESALQQIFAGTNVSYSIKGNDILLVTKDGKESKQNENKKTVTGVITDDLGDVVPGVAITIVGEHTGTTSDIDGKFSIKVNEGQELEIIFIGYKKQRIRTGKENVYNVQLIEDTQLLDEVVVVGYGIQKRSDLTGAISSVKAKELPTSATTSVEHMLAGKAAGMQVRALDAQPGGGMSILIRGAGSVNASNEPLYVIDGFPMTGTADPNTGNGNYSSTDAARSPLNSINPNDIESIEILKDASATAIYGARAANGVILITTKQGEKGKTLVTYDTKLGVQKMKNEWEVLNASQWMNTKNRYGEEQWLYKNKVGVYGDTDPNTVQPYKPYYTTEEILAAGKGTDWMKEVSRTGITQEHNVSISGATDQTNHLISINYYDQEGILKNNDFNRMTARINLTQEIRKWLKVGVKATGSRIKYNNPTLGGGQDSYKGTNENAGMMDAARIFSPLLPVRDANGKYTEMVDSPFIPNPMSLMDIDSKSVQNRIFAQGFLEFTPIKGFMFRSQFGVDKQDANSKLYLPKTTFQGRQKNGVAHINHNNSFDKLFNTTVSYAKTFNKVHNVSGMLGYEWQRQTADGYSMATSNFASDAVLGFDNIAAGKERPEINSYKTYTDFASYFGRLGYNYADKYLFTFTMRADGSDKFGSDNRWGYFPSGAVAWRMEQEDFMKNLDFVSNAKVRVSVGQTGNSSFGGSAFAYYSTGSDYIFGGKNPSTGISLSSNSNPFLKWETTTEYNFGLDLGFLNNRFNASLELYSKEIKDLLGTANKPYYFPVNTVNANIGRTSSKGFELSITSINTQGEFNWTTSVNLSRYVDKWKERNPEVVLGAHQSKKDPLRPIWGYELGGILQPGQEAPAHMPDAKPGTQIVNDIGSVDENGNRVWISDGKIGDADRILLGTEDPDLIYGITNTFEYKGFDLNIHLYGSLGWKRENPYLSNAASVHQFIEAGRNQVAIDHSKFWSSENPNAKWPNQMVSSSSSPGQQQFAIESADFLKVRNITLGYSFNNIASVNKYLRNMRIYADVANPFVWSKFTKLDPEFKGTYPSATTWTFGLNVQF